MGDSKFGCILVPEGIEMDVAAYFPFSIFVPIINDVVDQNTCTFWVFCHLIVVI